MTRAAAASANPAASLWDELREILRLTLQVFGDPRGLLEDLVLPRAEARRLASWISALEAAARALLAALAASLPAPAPAHPRGGGSMARTGGAAPPEASSADLQDDSSPESCVPISDNARSADEAPPEIPAPEAWARVSFRFSPRASRSGRRGGASRERRFLAVRGLAFRLEALIRVAASPEPYARRLARRLRVDPGLAAAGRRPETRRGRPPPHVELVDDAFALAGAAAQDPETG